MEVKRVGSVKQGDEAVGNEVVVKVTKNKIAPPFKEASFEIMYGKGISRVGEILDMAIAQDVIAKSGSWFSFEDARIGQGRENVKAKLEEDKELLDRIEAKLTKIAPATAGNSSNETSDD
jgi:recombination protein RecA